MGEWEGLGRRRDSWWVCAPSKSLRRGQLEVPSPEELRERDSEKGPGRRLGLRLCGQLKLNCRFKLHRRCRPACSAAC